MSFLPRFSKLLALALGVCIAPAAFAAPQPIGGATAGAALDPACSPPAASTNSASVQQINYLAPSCEGPALCEQPICDQSCCDPSCCNQFTCDPSCDCQGNLSCDCPCSGQALCQCARCQAQAASLDPYCRILPQDGPFRVRGWLDAGILGNTSSPASHFNGPYNSQQVDNGQFNQAYFILDRSLKSEGLSIGGRFDLLYGADYFVAQSAGLEATRAGGKRWNSSQYYGLALPQSYVEVGNTNLSVKGGHFYSIVGYEGVQAANNFFYSHAYSYQFAGPFTHWGGLGTWKLRDNWQIQAGLVNGWNTLDSTVNHANFMGGLKYTSDNQKWWSSFAIITGDQQNNPANLGTVTNGYANRTRYSFIVSRQLGSRAEYVFHQWLGSQAGGEPSGGTAMWYGIDQYLYYRMNDCWRLGTRVEWFRDEDGTRVGLTEPSNPNKAPLPGSYASWTIGANWTPRQNVMLRPELRWDSYSGTARPYDDGKKTYQLLLGLDAIVNF
jgi:hypothetical protein